MLKTDGLTWRYIPFLEAPGNLQMAIDAWLLNVYQPSTHRSVLRFYRWSPAAISLGCFQRSSPPNWRDLWWQDQPIEIVRRPSGGRAVLHQGDLTYAVVLPRGQGKQREIYEFICQFLINGWRSLQVELALGQGGRGYINHTSCFNTATRADLVANDGSKLIGSAQRKTETTVLQHGSMVINNEPQIFKQVFHHPPPWKQTLIGLAGQPSQAKILRTLQTSAQDHFKIQLICEPLTLHEWQEISRWLPKTVN